MIQVPGTYENTSSNETEDCVKCGKSIERGTMFIEHTTEDGKREVICHFCYYKMKQNNEL